VKVGDGDETCRSLLRVGGQPPTLCGPSSCRSEGQLRSLSRRPPMAGVLTLTDTKRPLDRATWAGQDDR